LPDNENRRGPAPAGQSGPPWDQAAALESLKNDRDLLRIVIETFLEETPQLTARLRKAVAESDAAQLNLAAHTLKGTLRFLAAEEGFQLALQLEMMAREANFEQAPRTFQSLEDHLARLAASLGAYLENSRNSA